MNNLLEPQPFEVTKKDGTVVKFLLSKFPAIAGREIITQYPLSAIPRLGEYKTNEAMMLKLMAFVAIEKENDQGQPVQIRLNSSQMIDNHMPDWEVLAKVEAAMISYNCSFFQEGRVSSFFDLIAQKLPVLASQILTQLRAQSSPQGTPPGTN